ncbi:uncharacterized protein LOC123405816 [Hordeum vulgare subsp. vulgare]|uniref:uncharacterized protein LOC123405816 n=1 Tax=Hordeum vulgare subsp. vulgare TaxID=112509 RepID=UPI001D1A4CA4|nr:uncharacterized protein LOC123405816 [Hordeum vulgare subsp. vulgare]
MFIAGINKKPKFEEKKAIIEEKVGIAFALENVEMRHSTGSLRLPAPPSTTSDAGATPAASALQRELFTKKGGVRRFSWGWRKEQQQQQAGCAVCPFCRAAVRLAEHQHV